jgi:hypothetical protein
VGYKSLRHQSTFNRYPRKGAGMITLTREEAQQVLDDLEALTAYIQGIDKGIVLKTQSIETLCARLAQPEPDIVQDAVVYGTGITKDGKRIDPASIYKEPEPVAWMDEGDPDDLIATYEKGFADGKAKREEGCAECGKKSSEGWALYCVKCSEREWQGLTDEEIKAVYGKDLEYQDGDYARYARAIEAKLKEKNA